MEVEQPAKDLKKPKQDTTEQSPPTPAKSRHIRDYWPHYHRTAIFMTIAMQLVIGLSIAATLVFNGVIQSVPVLIIVSIAIIAATSLANILLVNQLLQPLRDLAAALTHISGEPSDVKPPNIGAPSYQRDGFSLLLGQIYELSISKDDKKSPHSKQDLLESAFATSDASIIITDENGTVLYASPHAPAHIDTDGRTVMDLVFDDKHDFSAWLADCRDHMVHSSTAWLRIPDRLVGEEDRRIFDISASYEKASAAPVVLVFFDRTTLYQPEDDQLDFIAFAAHELRGPVTVIRGYADVISQEIPHTPENTELLTLLERLTVSANRLSGYISNILNASRYDRRHLRLHLVEQSLPAIYASIADDMNARARTQNRLLSVDIPTDLPTIAADASSLSEVMANLVDNAIKYSNEGGIVNIAAHVDGDSIRVDVTDHGIGMPSNVVGNLFHKFYRSHRSRETVAGTGIGLYISKAIIESHGGEIEVRSEEGRGSTFSFTVPIYATIADKLATTGSSNETLLRSASGGWIKNHAKFRG